MRCPACGFENPSGIRFCGGCAAALAPAVTCPSCGRANPPSFRFCGECGGALGSAPARAPGSYTPKHLAEKILTLALRARRRAQAGDRLFADVKGSMDLAGSLDPEELHRVLDRFFQILADGVHRFEGTVNQYTGDGIMALFGAPIAHEDHAQRACYAALAPARRAAPLHRRPAPQRGPLVLDPHGPSLGRGGGRQDRRRPAHGLHRAGSGRLARAADGVACCAGRASTCPTRRPGWSRVCFELAGLGEFALKGLQEPHARLRARRRCALAAALRRRARARAHPLRRARCGHGARSRRRSSARAPGHGQVVGVVAEAGVGKSRLCFEFLERCRARGIEVLEGRGRRRTARTSRYLPVLELFRSCFGITRAGW